MRLRNWRIPRQARTWGGWSLHSGESRKPWRRHRTRVYDGGHGPYRIAEREWRPQRASDPDNLGGWELPHRHRGQFRAERRKAKRCFDLTDAIDRDELLAILADSECVVPGEWHPFSCDVFRLREVRRVQAAMAGRPLEPPIRGFLYEAMTGNCIAEEEFAE
jgi:hypothetical protein